MAVMEHEMTLADAAERLWDVLPGHRVEILNGSIVVTPPADGPHQETLTELIVACHEAGGKQAGLKCLPGVGLWLPTGRDDYAIPDFALLDADYRDALVEKDCYAPHVFRMVLEVTSSNWANDLVTKVETYAEARVPVYVVVDRKHGHVLVLSDPDGKEYRTSSKCPRGAKVRLPKSIGIELELDADTLLDGEA
ncbi:Uma2 family endonuclease [Streptomyces sp. B-S-A8]|uniref:Uma2 family endonuclease n=1 Tax=Streptomyces solicavernae TaxID=3043614 RepID=A0ABT6RMD1_9ACTN|nr:Uma2 family endonuclease [Streptomyces sp. B-S-A8]MDI3385596.1 Uma2 family endonuclease [Streptomyces sp. B-S-A8]